jgi:hypothetical protein
MGGVLQGVSSSVVRAKFGIEVAQDSDPHCVAHACIVLEAKATHRTPLADHSYKHGAHKRAAHEHAALHRQFSTESST